MLRSSINHVNPSWLRQCRSILIYARHSLERKRSIDLSYRGTSEIAWTRRAHVRPLQVKRPVFRLNEFG